MAVTCNDLDVVAAAKLSISATLPATDDAAGYAALTFTDIEGITDLPSISGSYNDIPYDLVTDGTTCHKPGQFNPGSDTFNFARVLGKVGQTLIKTQFDGKLSTAFKLAYSNGDIDYCVGYFQSIPAQNGTADTVRSRACTVQWTRKPVEEPAP